jgi:UDP-GlcNAc:undecaprenyl-phosphate GlcNAc-1-phosphate transferase
MAAGLAGAALGFLPFNFNPARIFLGDAGTMFMGFLLSVLLLKLNLDGHPAVVRAGVPFLIAGVPLFDMTLVVLSRHRAGRPVFRGATDHSSHRLVALGRSSRQAAATTYAGAFLTGGAALVLLAADHPAVSWSVVAGTIGLGIALLALFERVPVSATASSTALTQVRQERMVSSAEPGSSPFVLPPEREQA